MGKIIFVVIQLIAYPQEEMGQMSFFRVLILSSLCLCNNVGVQSHPPYYYQHQAVKLPTPSIVQTNFVYGDVYVNSDPNVDKDNGNASLPLLNFPRYLSKVLQILDGQTDT